MNGENMKDLKIMLKNQKMKEIPKENNLNEHRQEKEHGWRPISNRKKPVKKESEYTYAFIGIIIGLAMGIITSIFMYRDAERCNSLLEENKILKEILYNK
jgi:hypothetical protein